MDSVQEFSFKVKIQFFKEMGLTVLCESYSINTEKHELTLYDAGGNIIGWFCDVAWFYAERRAEGDEE